MEKQKCWRTASNSVRIATDVFQDTKTESRVNVAGGGDGTLTEWPKNKTQKETELEEFRKSFRTSKRRKKKKQRSDEKEEVKTQNCFVCDKKTQMRNKATKL